MTSWQVVIPWIGPPGLLELCLRTMRLEDTGARVLVVDNTPDSSAHGVVAELGRSDVEVECWPDNLGIAASWNQGLARGRGATLLLSASVWFVNGLADFIAECPDRIGWGVRTPLAWHAHVVGPDCFDAIGEFDESFWPKEYEDTDYMRRMRLAGMSYDDLPIAGTSLRCLGDSIASHLGLVPKSDAPREHYLRKWGGDPGAETFDLPQVGPHYAGEPPFGGLRL